LRERDNDYRTHEQLVSYLPIGGIDTKGLGRAMIKDAIDFYNKKVCDNDYKVGNVIFENAKILEMS